MTHQPVWLPALGLSRAVIGNRRNLVDGGRSRVFEEMFFQDGHGEVKGGMFQVRGQFGQGRKDKHPTVHPGMGELQERVVKNEIIVEQEIKIKGTILMAGRLGITATAELLFNVEKQGEQFPGGETGLQLTDTIDKPVLGIHINRSAAVAGGQSLQVYTRVPAKPLPGLMQDTQGITQVGTKTDPGGGEILSVQGRKG